MVHRTAISISPYGIEVEIKAYTLTTKYEQFMEIKQKILLEVYKVAYEMQNTEKL